MMIESVQVRQRGAYDFETHYTDLCVLQSDVPLPIVKAHLHRATLNLNGDKVRAVDWVPILNALKINKSLETVAFRSFYKPPIHDLEKPGMFKRKIPALRSKEITYRLSRALKECLGTTASLSCLELQGVPLRERDLLTLTKGITKNQTMTHFSVEQCRIGDAGIEILGKGLKTSTTINSLNFSGCSLSWKGADVLAQVIKHQAMTRHNEAWRDSLRYRRPDLDRMPGIRRVTVNNNPLISDQGAAALAEVLKDDLWLKALDIQSCGVSSAGAKSLLDVLSYNTTMVVLDLRDNPLVDNTTLHSVTEQLLLNSNEEETQYKWLDLPKDDPVPTKPRPVTRRRRTKTLNSNFGRKTTIKVSSTSSRRRTKSVGSIAAETGATTDSSQRFAWRTAARANRLKGLPPNGSTGSFDDISTDSAESPRTGTTPNNKQARVESCDRKVVSVSSAHDIDTNVTVRKLLVEVEQVKRMLRNETEARVKADERIVELMIENSRLRNALMETKQGGVLDDDHILDSIEASFKQFHAFLDLLRDAGFGELISLADLDAKPAPPLGDKLPHTLITSYRPSTQTAHIGGLESSVKIDKSNDNNITFRNQDDPSFCDDVFADAPLSTVDLHARQESLGLFDSDADFEAKFFKSGAGVDNDDVDMSGIFPAAAVDMTFEKDTGSGVATSTINHGYDTDQTPTNQKAAGNETNGRITGARSPRGYIRRNVRREAEKNVQTDRATHRVFNTDDFSGDFNVSGLQDAGSLMGSFDIDAKGDDFDISREGPAISLSQLSAVNCTTDSYRESYISEEADLGDYDDDMRTPTTSAR